MQVEWDQDIVEDDDGEKTGDLVGHYYEAVSVAMDAERLLQTGGALAKVLFHARDEAIEALVKIIQNSNTTLEEMAVFRTRVRVYEELVKGLSAIFEEADEATITIGEINGNTLRNITEGDQEPGDD